MRTERAVSSKAHGKARGEKDRKSRGRQKGRQPLLSSRQISPKIRKYIIINQLAFIREERGARTRRNGAREKFVEKADELEGYSHSRTRKYRKIFYVYERYKYTVKRRVRQYEKRD